MQKFILRPFLTIFLLLMLGSTLVFAGDRIITNNSGSGNSVWVINGETSLIMNGFDLTPLSIPLPAQLDAVTLGVQTPSSSPVEVVVYQDSNGGSPIDAQFVGSRQVTISQAGTARITFDPPLQITAPVVWAGFYLPVGFEFQADTSGSSVLTYWAWTDNSTFNVSTLSSAGVLGPGDGSAPVNIDLEGIARINIEFITGQGTTTTTTTSTATTQTSSGSTATGGTTNSTSNVLRSYSGCGNLMYDREDIEISARGTFELRCGTIFQPLLPNTIIPNQNLEFRGAVYDIMGIGGYRDDPGHAERLVVPVTHCITPSPEEIDQAVIGIAYGIPRQWRILPTVRFGNQICAEVTHVGNIGYFVPETNQPSNINLVFARQTEISEFNCNVPGTVQVWMENNGFEPTNANTRVTVKSIFINENSVLAQAEAFAPILQPGEAIQLNFTLTVPRAENARHRLQIELDANGVVPELIENDNIQLIEYVLGQGTC